MPGPAGGGRSGGGGGIGGGARGGFSGGSHGGFSSSSHNTFRSGAHRPAGGFYQNNDPDDEKQGTNIGRVILIIVLLFMFGGPVLSLVGNVFSDLSSPVASPDIWAEIDSVIVEDAEWEDGPLFDIESEPRAKLDESLCKPSNVWYLDRCGLFILSDECDDVENALAYFYEKTGVQPLLVTARSINGQLEPDWDTVETYLYDLYIELFGEDEGHYIFLYFMHEDDSYTLYYMPGLDAMSIMDDVTSAILMDCIEWYYQESSSYGEMFASAFAEAADVIMYTAEADTSEPLTDYEVLSTAPPASTVPAVEVDSSEDLTAPVVELTSEPESVEVTYYEEITYYEEPDSAFIWDEDVTDQAVEHYITTDTLKYIAGGFVILLAVILFVVYILWDKKKMRDLEDDI